MSSFNRRTVFFYLQHSQFSLLGLAELESRSLDVDFIDEEQLKRLLQPPEESIVEPIETTLEAELPGEEEKQPAAREVPAIETEEAETEPAIVPEEELFEPPSQDALKTDDVVEIETVESAIPLEKISREEVNKRFRSLVTNLKVDLNRRSQSVQAKAQSNEEQRASATRVQKVQTIVSENQELFKEKKITAKWKQFPMSRIMRMEYQPKVDEVIRTHWKLPFEMDPSLEARVRVIISKSGDVLDFEIVESSSNRFFNHAVLQVFKNLNQLPPLPEDFSGESTEIGLRFTSKQFKTE